MWFLADLTTNIPVVASSKAVCSNDTDNQKNEMEQRGQERDWLAGQSKKWIKKERRVGG